MSFLFIFSFFRVPFSEHYSLQHSITLKIYILLKVFHSFTLLLELRPKSLVCCV